MAHSFVSRGVLLVLSVLALSQVACGASGAATRPDSDAALRFGRYASSDSVGYVRLNQARYRASVHGDLAQRILVGLMNRSESSPRRDAVFSAISEVDGVFLPLQGGTAAAPLAWNVSIVFTGVDLSQVMVWLEGMTESQPERITGEVGGQSAYILGEAALLETAPREALFGTQETLQRILANPAHVVHSFQTQNFREVADAQLRPSIFEAVVSLDGAELGPFGSIQGVVGMSVDLEDAMEVQVYGHLRSEEAAAAALGHFETFRQSLANHPYAAIFGAHEHLQGIEVSQNGSSFRIHARIEEAELHRILSQFYGFVQMADQPDDTPDNDSGDDAIPEFI